MSDTATKKLLALSDLAGGRKSYPNTLKEEVSSTEDRALKIQIHSFLSGLKFWSASSACHPADRRLSTHDWLHKEAVYIIAEL